MIVSTFHCKDISIIINGVTLYFLSGKERIAGFSVQDGQVKNVCVTEKNDHPLIDWSNDSIFGAKSQEELEIFALQAISEKNIELFHQLNARANVKKIPSKEVKCIEDGTTKKT